MIVAYGKTFFIDLHPDEVFSSSNTSRKTHLIYQHSNEHIWEEADNMKMNESACELHGKRLHKTHTVQDRPSFMEGDGVRRPGTKKVATP